MSRSRIGFFHPSDQRHHRHDPGHAEGRVAKNLNDAGHLLHRARLRQSHGHERIDWHKSDDHARAGEYAGAPAHFASIFRLRHAAAWTSAPLESMAFALPATK